MADYISWILTGTDDLCLTMDRSERSYQLLGGYGAGQHPYSLQSDLNQIVYITFSKKKKKKKCVHYVLPPEVLWYQYGTKG